MVLFEKQSYRWPCLDLTCKLGKNSIVFRLINLKKSLITDTIKFTFLVKEFNAQRSCNYKLNH